MGAAHGIHNDRSGRDRWVPTGIIARRLPYLVSRDGLSHSDNLSLIEGMVMFMEQDLLRVQTGLALQAHNGGLFVSRGEGCHPDRRLTSYELIFVRKGALSIQEEEHRFEVTAGQSLILWPERRHWGTAPFSPDLSFYWVHFTPQNRSSRVSPHDLKVSQYVTVSRPDHMTELFRRFLDDQESGALESTSATLLLML